MSSIPLQTIDTIIYDMDGVLINSEPIWKETEIEVFDSIGIDFIAVGGEKTVGLRIDEVVEYWYSRFPWKNKSIHQVVDEIMTRMVERIKKEGKPLTGAKESLQYFKENGYKIGLASSSYSVLIETTLSALGIGHYFDVILSAEKLPFGKPHPVIYLEAARQLNSSPSTCLVIEDSLNGIIAGKAAKMSVVAIPDGTHQPNPKTILADVQLNSLHEVIKLFRGIK